MKSKEETSPTPPSGDGPVGKAKTIFQDFKELRKLWPDLKQHRKLLGFAVALIPLVSLLQMASPLILKETIDRGMMGTEKDFLYEGALYFLIAVLLEYGCRAGQSLSTATAVHRMIFTLRRRLINHVMTLPAPFHDRMMSGALVTRATSDFDNLSEALNQGVLTSVVDCAVLLGCLIGMFTLNWQLALMAMLILPVIAFMVGWFSSALKRSMLSARRKLAEMNAFAQECLYGNTTIKLLTAEAAAGSRYHTMNVAYRNAQMESVILDAVMFAVLEGIASITIGLLLWWALAPHKDALSAGLVVAFVQYVQQLFEPLKQLGSKMAMLQGAFTSIDRIFGIMDIQESIAGTETLARGQPLIRMEHVSFAYKTAAPKKVPAGGVPTAERKTLRDVSLQIPAGESLALVGATGGGKSTVIKLLTKLYDGYEGNIFFGDQELRMIDPAEIRRRIAIVPQDVALFAGTLAFNVGMDRGKITRDDIEWAVQLVGADRFIAKLPGGLDFIVEEQGANLSQGEKQLISFARALASRPKIVVMDEATSSVDHECETAIQQAIEKILQGHTFIVIAHRLSTIKRCQQILVVDKGEIIERGTHQSLVQANGSYARLYQSKA